MCKGKINRMDLQEFVHEGYLQELNRQFLHPLGLALEVVADKETNKMIKLGGVWDYRDHPEGMRFDQIDQEKRKHILDIQMERGQKRIKKLGYVFQPE